MDLLFQQAQQLRLWRSLDVQFARMLARAHEPGLMLACACLSADAGAGHVCLPLTLLNPGALFNGRHPLLAEQAWRLAGQPARDDWRRLLNASPAVSDGSRPTPLVLDNDRLYLQRMWQNERRVAAFFNAIRPLPLSDELWVSRVLDRFFPPADGEVDWQKVAAGVAISHSAALITGGPGTGKTSTVARLLAAMVVLGGNKRLRIQMAAPTGKAAARLSESLGIAVAKLGLNDEQRRLIPAEAVTLHRLLGAQANSQRMRYHQGNPLHVDILIIDEASMVDLPMMASLLAAMPPEARVIFLGDRRQLASVEAGAVLGDLCFFAENGYSAQRGAQLGRLTGFQLPESVVAPRHRVGDSLCWLRKSYRFDDSSGIGRLADAVNRGDSRQALALLTGGQDADVDYAPVQDAEDYLRLLTGAVTGYRDYLRLVKQGAEPGVILAAFNQYRLLCALREGPFGVAGLNTRLEQALAQAGLISRPPDAAARGYAGRPLMINRNAPNLGLYNGDIGIMLPNARSELRVYFALPDGTINDVPLSRLPDHETAFSMTVHKSQGSEFRHTALVLPNHCLPVLTRELVYTAITRARQRLTVYANADVLSLAIATPTERRSGLRERLLPG